MASNFAKVCVSFELPSLVRRILINLGTFSSSKSDIENLREQVFNLIVKDGSISLLGGNVKSKPCDLLFYRYDNTFQLEVELTDTDSLFDGDKITLKLLEGAKILSGMANIVMNLVSTLFLLFYNRLS